METFLHPDDKVANETIEDGIEINWEQSKEAEEEWFWIWA
jgi:hypothetical protein